MIHIILGDARDPQSRHMLTSLQARGHRASLLESPSFPSHVSISLYPGRAAGRVRLQDGSSAGFDDIGSVYWRHFSGVSAEAGRANAGTSTWIACYDSMACLRSWFQHKNGTRWFNSWTAFQSHQEKPHQLALASQAGALIPRTYVGNDPEAILAFCAEVPETIFKPVLGGSHTQRITARHLAGEHLQRALSQAPITLQQYVGGTNVRTYAIGETCYTAELHSSEIDFRTDVDLRIVPIATPPHIAAQTRAIMDVLDLNWTAIDWRRDDDGQYYFLEANPSPMFTAFEQRSGYPITDTLIAHMTASA